MKNIEELVMEWVEVFEVGYDYKWLQSMKKHAQRMKQIQFQFSNPAHRVFLAKLMMDFDYLIDAIRILEYTVHQDKPISNQRAYAHACLNLGIALFRLRNDPEQSYFFIRKGFDILEEIDFLSAKEDQDSTEQILDNIPNGLLWMHCLNFLKKMGRQNEAMEEIELKTAKLLNCPNSETNSYLFSATIFKAQIYYENSNQTKAMELLKQALSLIKKNEELIQKNQQPDGSDKPFELFMDEIIKKAFNHFSCSPMQPRS